jgi:hypothetical protein
MAITEDLDVYLQDFGVPVVWESVSNTGLLDMPDELIGDGMSISTEYSVLVRSSLFAGILRGDSITVDGTGYTVRDFKKVGDGAFARVALSKT